MPEDTRTRLHRKLTEAFGVEEADFLLDRPPGGWADLVTNQSLELRLAAFEARIEGRMEARFHELRAEIERGFREQTWRLVGVTTALMAIVVAALRV